ISRMATAAPSASNRVTMALPIPNAPPVTSATLPSSPMSSLFPFSHARGRDRPAAPPLLSSWPLERAFRLQIGLDLLTQHFLVRLAGGGERHLLHHFHPRRDDG